MRGFCYVEFEELGDAEIAREHYNNGENKLELGGKQLSVQYAFGDRKSLPNILPSQIIKYSSSWSDERTKRSVLVAERN